MTAKSRKPDLLVLGAQGSGSASGGMLLGSVTMAVTYRPECPALVINWTLAIFMWASMSFAFSCDFNRFSRQIAARGVSLSARNRWI
jgi:hypothetical protein